MGLAATEAELADRTSTYLKAELKRAKITYAELAERLNKHGMEETETSIAGKLSRATFGVAFFLAVLAVLLVQSLVVLLA